ncbi:unnamed protein product [Closterium sp. NIES-64]|nr:unnamed protein product [Closterium sp. NIES-64]
MAGEPIRWAEIDAFAGGGGCGDVCGARRTLSANAHPLGGSRLRSPAATVARNRWTDSETPDALTDSVTDAGAAVSADGVALEQQCRRMEAVGLRIDNIDLTCLDAEPAPHSPQSAQSAQSARSLALARLSAATAGAPANDPDGAPDVGETRRDSWRAPAGARKSEWGEAAEGQEAGEGTGEAHVKYAFSLVPTPRAKRDENSQWSDDSVQVQHPDGSDLPRPRAPSLDGGADVTEPEGSLDFAAIFANGTRDRVTLPGDAPSPSAPPVLVSAAVSAHKGGNAPPSPCAPVLLPGVIYCANRDCTTGSLGQGLPTPVQTVTNDISTTHFAATGQFSHGPPDSMHQSSFRSPHSSAHSSPYSSLSILPPSSSTVSYDHTLPSRSAIPTQASYSPTSSTFHSFASPACASPLGASPACTSPISATHAPSFPPTMPRPARQPARGVHRRSSSLSVLTENLPGVAPAAFNSPCSIRPAHTHLSASTVVSRPSAEKPPTPLADAVEEEGGEGSEEGSDGSFSRSPVVAQLPWKDGKGRHGAPMQAQRLGVPGHAGRLGSPTQAGRIGSPMQAERLGSPTQAPRLGDTVQVRRFSPGGGGFPAGGSGRAGAEIKVWETSERGLLQGKGRSVSNRETGYRSMSSDNVLGEWSDIEADAEWVAVGGKQANAREAGGLDGGSPNFSGYRGMRGGAAAAHEDVRGGRVRGQEEGVKSTRSVLKKMLWRFKSGPGGQAEESAKGKTPPQQEQEEEEAEEARQGEQEQERHGGHTVRVFAVAEC